MFKKKYFSLNLVLIIYFLITSSSYAYLDPGTLNIIIQSIIAGAVAFLSIITVYWNKIISFISKFLKRKN